MLLEDKNRLLKEAELLDQLFDSYERVLSRLEEKMPEKAKYEFLTGRIQTGKKAGRVLQEEKKVSGGRKAPDRTGSTGT